MALNKTALKASLESILGKASTEDNVGDVAAALADAVEAYVKTGTAVGVDTNGAAHNLMIQ